MPKLILKFDDRVLQECPVGTHPVTIGRLPDNTIVVDNPAVSGRHARVFREGDHYVVEDLKSTNGTYVNDKPVTSRTLLDRDIVLVGKHSLLFSQEGGDQPDAPAVESAQFVPEIGGTMMLDTQRQKSLLAKADSVVKSRLTGPTGTAPTPAVAAPAPLRIGSVRVVAGKTTEKEFALTSVTSIIGKIDTAQIRLKGWFKPKIAAAIARKGGGYTVTPMGAKTVLNGQAISGRQDLRDGDLIEVGGLTLEFHLKDD